MCRSVGEDGGAELWRSRLHRWQGVFMERIRYGLLSPGEQQVYRHFQQVFARYGDRVELGEEGRGVDAMKVAQAVLGDTPHIAYFDKTQLRVTSTFLGGQEIRLCGAVPPQRAMRMAQELEGRVRAALGRIDRWNPLTDYDRLLCIYEYMQDTMAYDLRELQACRRLGRGPSPMAHTAYGTLVQGKDVCDGIAAAFCLLAQRMGFPCTVVGGRATFAAEGYGNHAWNIIRLRSGYYHVDPTWDLNKKEKSGEYSYEYFCVDDDTVSGDHLWDPAEAPLCPRGDMSYYWRSRCYANNLTQLEELFTRIARSRQRVVRARLAPGIPVPEPAEQYLGQMLSRSAAAAGRRGAVRFRWNGSTRCFFGKLEEV